MYPRNSLHPRVLNESKHPASDILLYNVYYMILAKMADYVLICVHSIYTCIVLSYYVASHQVMKIYNATGSGYSINI